MAGFGIQLPGFGLDPFGDPVAVPFVLGTGSAFPLYGVFGEAVPYISAIGTALQTMNSDGNVVPYIDVTGTIIQAISASGSILSEEGGTAPSAPFIPGGPTGGGGTTLAADSTQMISASMTINFMGATNTIIDAIGGALGITLTLPDATTVQGQTVKIVKIDSGGTVTVNTTAGQLIDGLLTFVLHNQWEYANFEAIGSAWVLTAYN